MNSRLNLWQTQDEIEHGELVAVRQAPREAMGGIAFQRRANDTIVWSPDWASPFPDRPLTSKGKAVVSFAAKSALSSA